MPDCRVVAVRRRGLRLFHSLHAKTANLTRNLCTRAIRTHSKQVSEVESKVCTTHQRPLRYEVHQSRTCRGFVQKLINKFV